MLLQIPEVISTAESVSTMTPTAIMAVVAIAALYAANVLRKENKVLQEAMLSKAEISTTKMIEVAIESKLAFEKISEQLEKLKCHGK
jgi:hypothetical protein